MVDSRTYPRCLDLEDSKELLRDRMDLSCSRYMDANGGYQIERSLAAIIREIGRIYQNTALAPPSLSTALSTSIE